MNFSSVAVLWFGASRVNAGSIQIGQLTAFLSYLIQILLSVMMATVLGFLPEEVSASFTICGRACLAWDPAVAEV